MPILRERVENIEESHRAIDYSYARARATGTVARGYEVAHHFARVISERRRYDTTQLEISFRKHVEKWKRDTGHLSSVTKAVSHPRYLRIVGLSRHSRGYEIERLLLKELESEPDHWFDALTAVTGEDPVKPEDDFDEAVRAWLSWGHKRGII